MLFIGEVDRVICSYYKIAEQERRDIDMFQEKFSGILVLSRPFADSTAEAPVGTIRLDYAPAIITPDDIGTANTEFPFPVTGKIYSSSEVSGISGNDTGRFLPDQPGRCVNTIIGIEPH